MTPTVNNPQILNSSSHLIISGVVEESRMLHSNHNSTKGPYMRKTILVVDDFNSIRQFVCEMLEKKGYNTVGASNGTEAYDFLSTKGTEVNLVLTDYNMPDLNGNDLLTKIKSSPAIAHVPVIFLTSELSPEVMKTAKEKGLTAWIKKPYRSETFFREIENALQSNANQ